MTPHKPLPTTAAILFGLTNLLNLDKFRIASVR